jgi:nucleotide-binding universal stress UspA family protein
MSDYPFKHILLATEHTDFDAGAERIAFAMAKRCGISLRVVVPLLSNSEYEVEAPQHALRAEQEVAIKVAALRSSAKAFGVELDIHVRRGAEAYQEIVAEAVASHADLIVIRRRGNPSFLANLLVGEMVSKVIRDAPCAVLTVPRAAEFWQHQVLAAVSDAPATHMVVTLAAKIAAVCDIPVTLVSVAADQVAAEKLNAEHSSRVATICRQVQTRALIGKPVPQILAVAKEISADLMVIGRQRYQLIPFSLGGKSIMQQIAGAMDVPTLIVPA